MSICSETEWKKNLRKGDGEVIYKRLMCITYARTGADPRATLSLLR